MVATFLKTPDNNIWKDADGVLLKTIPFSTDVVQRDLSFFGMADLSYLTLVNGAVSEAYDIRGTGNKMIQNTVVYRPVYTNGQLDFVQKTLSTTATQNYKSVFLVIKYVSVGYLENTITGLLNRYNVFYTDTNTPVICNLSEIGNSEVGKLCVVHTHSLPVRTSLSAVIIGSLGSYSNYSIKSWGWYDRVLTKAEAKHNVNALMQMFNIL